MTNKTRNLLIGVPLAAIFILVGWLVFDELHRVTPPPPPVPNPNGYDDLVKAGQMVSGDFGNVERFNERELQAILKTNAEPIKKELRELLTRNAEAINLARLGLTRECRVPIQYSAAFDQSHIADVVAIRHFVQVLRCESRLAEIENCPSDAFKSYLDQFRLGNQSARGGRMLDKLVGMAIEGSGIRGIQKIMNQLSLPECRDTIQTLESLEINTESVEAIFERDKIFTHQAYSWIARSRMTISSMIQDRTLHPALLLPKFKMNIQSKENVRRKLLLDLAARAYELEKGERPKTIRELVPNYLKTIPLDPLTGTNMVYQP